MKKLFEAIIISVAMVYIILLTISIFLRPKTSAITPEGISKIMLVI